MNDAERIRRRNLPHWDVPHAAYFITTCLEGSIPARGLLEIEGYRTGLRRSPRPSGKSKEDWALDCWKLVFARTDSWLDVRPAVCHLKDPRLAQLVVNTLYYFAGTRYDLLAFVVMPSHVHWVFRPIAEWVNGRESSAASQSPREQIIHSINRYSARECNKLLGVSGRFWQHESYDHWVRDPDELERIILYIEGNPVKAGLVDAPEQWPYSSASDRRLAGTEIGVPLVRT